MSNSQTLNIDSLLSDPFVSKLHLIRDIGKSSLDALFVACKQSFGEATLKHLLTTFCATQLHSISNIDENVISSSLRRSLTRHHEKFNPSNPALLDIVPAAVLSKCFSYTDVHTLLCSAELVSRDWFHVSRLASSISQFPATANIPYNQQSFTLQRLRNATTLHYSNTSASDDPIDLLANVDALAHIHRVYADGVLPLFMTKCPAPFLQQIHKIEISYASQGIDGAFWAALTDKCHNLRVLKLRNIIISKAAHPNLIKFISGCKHLTSFECHRWRFSNANMTMNATIKALSEHCHALHSLRVEYCRVNDKIMSYITKLMEYKLRSLAMMNCNRLKMNTFAHLAQKQQQLYNKTHSKKRLYAFAIDDKMISGAILDQFVGLKSLSIASDHLSGSIAYSALNRYNSLRDVSIQFRSSIDRLSSHSSSQFEWELFFKEIGRTLVNFECNCSVIRGGDRKVTDISNLKLLSKEDYQNFMILDGSVFRYITTFCKQLKTLKMSGWKFDNEAMMTMQSSSENTLAVKKQRISGRSHSMWFLNGGKHNRNRKHQTHTARAQIPKSKRFDHDFSAHAMQSSKRNRSAMNTAIKTQKVAVQSGVPRHNESAGGGGGGSVMENMIMIPISNLLQQPQLQTHYNRDNNRLDYMKLEWMFDFGDMPSLNSLNFWCDTVLGLKCTMSMNEELETGSVVILEWNQNWTAHYMTPTIICHNKLKHNKSMKTKQSRNKSNLKTVKTKTK